MPISLHIYEGIQITGNSLVECVQYFLVKIKFSFKKLLQVVEKLFQNLPPNSKNKVYFDNWFITLELLLHSDPECANKG